MGAHRQSGHQPEHGGNIGHQTKRLLMAMTVQPGLILRQGLQFERQPSGLLLGDQEFLEQHGLGRNRLGLGSGQHGLVLVAQSEQAGRLQPDHGDALLGIGPHHLEQPARLDARLLNHAGRECGSAAAKRSAQRIRLDHAIRLAASSTRRAARHSPARTSG